MTTPDRISRAYSERTAAAVGMARFALMCGFAAGIGKDGNEHWDDEWRVVLYIDTPTGQVSWHIAPEDQHLLSGLPAYEGVWDGTFRSRDGSFCKWYTRAVDPAAIREAALREAAEACIAVSVDPLTRAGGEHAPWMKATAEDCSRVILALIDKEPKT